MLSTHFGHQNITLSYRAAFVIEAGRWTRAAPAESAAGPERSRRDGWTPERQLRFLAALARTRSVTRAAAAAGMSRESAYRLRTRRDGALFAAAWDRALQRPHLSRSALSLSKEPALSLPKGHNIAASSRRLARDDAGKTRGKPPEGHKVEEV